MQCCLAHVAGSRRHAASRCSAVHAEKGGWSRHAFTNSLFPGCRRAPSLAWPCTSPAWEWPAGLATTPAGSACPACQVGDAACLPPDWKSCGAAKGRQKRWTAVGIPCACHVDTATCLSSGAWHVIAQYDEHYKGARKCQPAAAAPHDPLSLNVPPVLSHAQLAAPSQLAPLSMPSCSMIAMP